MLILSLLAGSGLILLEHFSCYLRISTVDRPVGKFLDVMVVIMGGGSKKLFGGGGGGGRGKYKCRVYTKNREETK